MTVHEWPQVVELIDQLWPRYAGKEANGSPKFPREQQMVVLEGLARFELAAVLAAFRAHAVDEPDGFKPKFKVVGAALRSKYPRKSREWRDEYGRTDREYVAHLKHQREIGERVLAEVGEEVVAATWERLIAAEVAAGRQPVADRFRADGPYAWPVTVGQAIAPRRFQTVPGGC